MSEQGEGTAQAGHRSAADYQQAAAQEGTAVPYDQAAAQAVGAVIDPEAAGESADAGPAIAQMTAERGALLPFEQRLDAMMRQFEEQRDTMAAQIEQLQRQLGSAQAQLGPAAVTQYADAAHQRTQSIAAANPDLGRDHFADVVDLTGKLAAGAKDVADGSADPGILADLAAPVEAWFRDHEGKHLEGGDTVLHDLKHLAAEARKLTA
jgi:hypothetical protein